MMLRLSACQAHPGGEVVEREQFAERRRALGLLLQRVDDAQLPVQQGLVPLAEARQDLPQAVAHARLGGGRRAGRALHAEQRGGDGLDLGAGTVRAGPRRAARLLLAGELPGSRRQAGHFARDPAGERPCQQQRDEHHDQPGADDDRRLEHCLVVRRGRPEPGQPVQRPVERGGGGRRPQQDKDDNGHRQPDGELETDRPGCSRGSLIREAGYSHKVTPAISPLVERALAEPCVLHFLRAAQNRRPSMPDCYISRPIVPDSRPGRPCRGSSLHQQLSIFSSPRLYG